MSTRSYNGTNLPALGDEIRFVRGKYADKDGWYENGRNATAKQVYVIVDLKNGKYVGTRVNKTSVVKKAVTIDANASYSDLIFDQHPDLAKLMENLCTGVAECRLDPEDIDEITLAFKEKLILAAKKQNKKGAKARYRYVSDDSGNVEESTNDVMINE